MLAKSNIAGWGCFTKFSVSKGDFIGEYVGEVISHDEAERRGSIADQQVTLAHVYDGVGIDPDGVANDARVRIRGAEVVRRGGERRA